MKDADECARVEAIVLKDGYPNKDWVGKDATKIRGCWYPSAQRNVDCLREVAESHPFVQKEMLMPVTGLVRVPDA